MKFFSTKNIVMTAIITALATLFALPVFHVHIPGADFLVEMEFSDVPVLLAACYINPLAGLAAEVLKSVIRLSFTETGGLGELVTCGQGVAAIFPMFFFPRFRSKASVWVRLAIGIPLVVAFDLVVGKFVLMPIAGIADPNALWYLVLPVFAVRAVAVAGLAGGLGTAMHRFLRDEFGGLSCADCGGHAKNPQKKQPTDGREERK